MGKKEQKERWKKSRRPKREKPCREYVKQGACDSHYLHHLLFVLRGSWRQKQTCLLAHCKITRVSTSGKVRKLRGWTVTWSVHPGRSRLVENTDRLLLTMTPGARVAKWPVFYIRSQCYLNVRIRSKYLWPHESQYMRLPYPSPTPEACSNSYSSSRWCYPTISSSVVPFASCPQSLPASGSCPMSQFFASDGQSIGSSASASALPMNIQDWFPLGLTSLISLQSKGLSRVLQHHSTKASILCHSAFFIVQLSHKI